LREGLVYRDWPEEPLKVLPWYCVKSVLIRADSNGINQA
jgi:hypothetical protein